MDKNAIWKWLVLVGLTAWSLVIVTPLHEKIKLGLDLQGGTRFVLEVDTSELEADAAKDAQPRALEVIRNRVDAMGIAEPVIYTEPGNRIIVEIPGMKAEDRERAKENLKRAAFLEFRLAHPKNDQLVEDLFTKGLAPEGYKIVVLDEQGGNGQYRKASYYKRDKTKDAPGTTEEAIRARLPAFQAPRNYEFMLEREMKQNQELFRPHFVEKRRQLTGESLSNAGVDYLQFGQPVVTLRFDGPGARRFANLTKDYAPGGAQNPGMNSLRQLAIILDGSLYSAPVIREAIYGGRAQIEGNFSVKEAQDLSIVLRAGALPAPVKLLEVRTVDPTLGKDSIQSGKMASIVGGAAVLVFMVLYYTLAGSVANIALVLNIVLLPIGVMLVSGIFGLFGGQGGGGAIELPTLTLPGIAGIALTIGMAVDANVLIYERMREEQAAGKRFKFVIGAGYDKAFSAIFDSNLTTLLSAAILFWQGTGPVRGYAVMLSAGIVVSMYTALVCTRMIFDILSAKTKVEKLKMLQWVKVTNIDFLNKIGLCGALSLLVIIGSWAVFFSKGKSNFGVDFTGGTAITYAYTNRVPAEAVRDSLDAAGVKGASIQYQRAALMEGSKEAVEYLEIKTDFESGDKVSALMTNQFGASGYHVVKEDSVGPQIGKELQKKATIAVLLSMVMIVIYVSWRFEFPFAAGAVIALLHDVLVAAGVYCLLGRQMSVQTIAALLTIIGYSVNDTIVIFDRIRENVKLNPGKPFREIANLSVNQTLGRTLLTSFATMLTVAALLVFGGGAINDFALVLFIGMISGVYSTVYVATPVVLFWHREKKPADAKAA
jgi:SecD/SecF fusion protein